MAVFNTWVKRHRKCKAYNGEYFEKIWQVSDWRSEFNKPTLLTSLISSLAWSTSAVVTVFTAPYVVCKWLHVYHYFSSYIRKIEVFSSVCCIALCEILPSREKVYVFFEDPSYTSHNHYIFPCTVCLDRLNNSHINELTVRWLPEDSICFGLQPHNLAPKNTSINELATCNCSFDRRTSTHV